MFFAGLYAFYVHDPGFERVIWYDRSVFDPGLVGVDGIDGIFEDLGDLIVVGDAHADQGEDAEVDIEQFVFL
jgi:hypothetical protein